MNVTPFPDIRSLDAKTALARLTEYARSLNAFGPTVDFDAPVWDLSDIKRARPSAAQTSRLFFTRITARETRSMEGRIAFEPAFGNLIKTIITLREFNSPSGQARYRKLLQASRHLYEELADRDFDPVGLTTDHFEAACSAVAKTSPSNRYQIGQDLAEIAEFTNKHALSKLRIAFKNSHERQRYDQKIDDTSKDNRASKMPSEELIDAVIAMSEIVREKGNDADILRAAIVVLLMCAPWRINELLNLLETCERTDTVTDVLTGDKHDAFGIAYCGSKGAPDSIKWIPTAMVEVAKRALADIRRITQSARDAALFMENNPGRAYLAEPWRLADPDTLLTMIETANATGLGGPEASRYWLNAKNVPVATVDGKLRCRLGDLEAAILRSQPKLPADQPQTLSQYLLLVPDHYFHEQRAPIPALVTFVTDAQIHGFLSTSGDQKSVFERLDILDENGKPYVVTSHAFRHYLNTIAQDGELGQLDIARWSGRKSIAQNAAYDHTDGRQVAKRMREAHNAMSGPMAETIKRLPMDRAEFLTSRIKTAHMTDIGACVQNFSLAPCDKHGDCVSCGDHRIIKGNAVHKARAERLLVEHETMLKLAKNEMDEGNYDASTWVQHNEKVVAGLKKTIAAHADTEIGDGTIVQV
jgi:hypothetical protein